MNIFRSFNDDTLAHHFHMQIHTLDSRINLYFHDIFIEVTMHTPAIDYVLHIKSLKFIPAINLFTNIPLTKQEQEQYSSVTCFNPYFLSKLNSFILNYGL